MLRAILSLALVLSGAYTQTSSKPQNPAVGRQRPPRMVECPRNHLTSYTGRLTSYNRSEEQLQFRMRTDWDTDEEFTLPFAKGEDPTSRFLLRSDKFQPGDWRVIESAKGHLRPGVRATVWECKGGGRPQLTIDWLPPPESQKN